MGKSCRLCKEGKAVGFCLGAKYPVHPNIPLCWSGLGPSVPQWNLSFSNLNDHVLAHLYILWPLGSSLKPNSSHFRFPASDVSFAYSNQYFSIALMGLAPSPWPMLAHCSQNVCAFAATNPCPDDAGKMSPESGFLFMQSKNELHKHTGSKQAKSLLQESKQHPEMKSPPPLSYRDFYPLKMGGVPMWGPERCGFLLLALPSYLYQSLSNRCLGVEMSPKSHNFFVLFFH